MISQIRLTSVVFKYLPIYFDAIKSAWPRLIDQKQEFMEPTTLADNAAKLLAIFDVRRTAQFGIEYCCVTASMKNPPSRLGTDFFAEISKHPFGITSELGANRKIRSLTIQADGVSRFV